MLNIEPTSENGKIRISVAYNHDMNYNKCIWFSLSYQFNNPDETSFHPYGSILNALTPVEVPPNLLSVGSSYFLIQPEKKSSSWRHRPSEPGSPLLSIQSEYSQKSEHSQSKGGKRRHWAMGKVQLYSQLDRKWLGVSKWQLKQQSPCEQIFGCIFIWWWYGYII